MFVHCALAFILARPTEMAYVASKYKHIFSRDGGKTWTARVKVVDKAAPTVIGTYASEQLAAKAQDQCVIACAPAVTSCSCAPAD